MHGGWRKKEVTQSHTRRPGSNTSGTSEHINAQAHTTWCLIKNKCKVLNVLLFKKDYLKSFLFFAFISSHSNPVCLEFKCHSKVNFFLGAAGKLRNGQSKQMKWGFNPQFSETESERKSKKLWSVQPSLRQMKHIYFRALAVGDGTHAHMHTCTLRHTQSLGQRGEKRERIWK